MAEQLPPDLSRLGDEIDPATAPRLPAPERRAGRRRRPAATGGAGPRARKRRAERRRRLAATVVAATVALIAAAPGVLAPGARNVDETTLAAVRSYEPTSCDQPRGATFAALQPCASPGATNVSPDPL